MIRQYCYLSLHSPTVTAAEVTARLLLEPDRVAVRGSRRTRPKAIPVHHSWEVLCDLPGLTIDEQLDRVVSRVAPAAADIASWTSELASRGVELSARLQVVRNFDDDEGQEDDAHDEVVDGVEMRRLGGQHQLLGWHLDRSVLEFLTVTGAELDIDEYG